MNGAALPVARSVFDDIATAARRFQAKNAFTTQTVDDHFGLIESHILIDLDGAGELSLAELTLRLNLPREKLRQTVAQLIRRGFIKSDTASDDRRRVTLKLTPKARRCLADDDERVDRRMMMFAAAIGENAVEKFIDYCNRVGQGRLVPPAVQRESEHRLRPAIRRLTRGMGLFRSDVFHSEQLTPLAWHILCEVGDRQEGPRARDLANELNARKNTVSMTLAMLEKRKLIERDEGDDAREKILTLTSDGMRVVREASARVATAYEQAMSGFSLDEVRHFNFLLVQFMGESSSEPAVVIRRRMSVVRVESEEERIATRVALVSMLAKTRSISRLGESVVHRSGLTFRLLLDGILGGIFDLVPEGKTHWIVNHCEFDGVSAAEIREAIPAAFGLAQGSSGRRIFRVRDGSCSTDVARMLKAALARPKR